MVTMHQTVAAWGFNPKLGERAEGKGEGEVSLQLHHGNGPSAVLANFPSEKAPGQRPVSGLCPGRQAEG